MPVVGALPFRDLVLATASLLVLDDFARALPVFCFGCHLFYRNYCSSLLPGAGGSRSTCRIVRVPVAYSARGLGGSGSTGRPSSGVGPGAGVASSIRKGNMY